MYRTTPRTSGDRVAMGLSRSVIDTINDSPFMQTLGLKVRGKQLNSDVEHFEPFGTAAVVMGKTTDEQAKAGMVKGAAEVILGTLTGNSSHPIAFPAADRRFRINGLGPGESGSYDAYKQFLHLGKDAARLISPKRASLEVSKEKQSGGGSSQAAGSGGGQRKNNGADVKAEREHVGGIVFNEDGTWLLKATGAGKIQIGDVTWEFSADGLKQTGGKHTHDGKNVGKDHKHGGVMSGSANTAAPEA